LGGRKHTEAESEKEANITLLEALISADFSTVFQDWEKRSSQNAMVKAMKLATSIENNPLLCHCNLEC
jgi:hypothetical protein